MPLANSDVPMCGIVVILVGAMVTGVTFAALMDRYGSYLSPGVIRFALGIGGVTLLLILLVVGVRKLFR